MEYPVATIGTAVAVGAAFVIDRVGSALIRRRPVSPQEKYGWRTNLGLLTTLAALIAIAGLWAHLLPNKGTFFGLIGAGLAFALKEPLLSIAGRLSIWFGHLYRVGDRIEFESMAGDVIGIGVFYTRMLEIGNWIHGDQATGRIVQFPNASVYQHPVYNYTQNFSYIWDELMLPVTYASDVAAATEILTQTGEEYTRDFLKPAAAEIDKLRSDYLLPDLTLEPKVYTRVTSNYVELTMRYLVEPRKRRAANSWLFSKIFERVQSNINIGISSETYDLTVHPPEKKEPQAQAVTPPSTEKEMQAPPARPENAAQA
jgi:small-conductance mechanosensitive channel